MDSVSSQSESDENQNKDLNLLNIISTKELIDSMYNYIPSGIKLITRDDKIIFNFIDLDYDSIHEVFVLGVDYDENTDLNGFIDYSRLFEEDTKPYHFYLFIFSAREEILLLDTLDLGMQYVFLGISRFKINESSKIPYVVCVTFQVQEGEIQKWLVFRNGLKPDSQLNLEHTFSNKLVIDDINSDGNIDIIVMERGAEEGTGFETFLTWIKWDGQGFKEYSSTNIVRNLKTFLNASRELILEHDWKNIITNYFGDNSYYVSKGWSNQEMIFKAFGFGDVYNEENADKDIILSGVNNVVFPEIFENPFILEDENGLYFNLAFRIDDTNGVTIISEIPVYMSRNPFGDKQFYFRIN